ncbi:MAG TPA: hypothetical protein VMW83_00305 [Spirochaetia bacterium]|nr:hypothetical protein [Spirochaetia bacterium]
MRRYFLLDRAVGLVALDGIRNHLFVKGFGCRRGLRRPVIDGEHDVRPRLRSADLRW